VHEAECGARAGRFDKIAYYGGMSDDGWNVDEVPGVRYKPTEKGIN
jgi:hypothetical protein